MIVTNVLALVRTIQVTLGSRVESTEEELMDLASQHEELVEVVRVRLDKVERLLNQGLRDEAIELAEQDPNLNDVLTALDFPELGPWNELLESKGIQPVPVIPIEAAAELNDAYLASGSIEKLLYHYRTISLARAPLSKRISALRRLAQKDDQNPIWKQDLTTFEKHRVKELKAELDSAVKSEDLAAVAELDQELSGAPWAVEVPASIRQQARASHTALRRKAALAELKTLSHQLSDAYAAFDRHTAKQLQQRFLAVQGIAAIPANHPLMDIAGPALDWLNEEARNEAVESEHKTAVAEIESALDRKTTVEELEKLYHKATRNGHSLPLIMETRLAERRDQLIAQAKRTRFLIAAGAAAACVAAIAVVTLMVQTVSFNKAVAGHNEQLGKLLDAARKSGEVGPVLDYLDQIKTDSPSMLKTPELLGRQQETENLASSENGRRGQKQQLLASIEKVIDGNPSLSEFADVFAILEQLKKLSKGEQERAQFLETEQRLTDRQAEAQKIVDDAFNQELANVSDEIEQLSEDSVNGYDAVNATLSQLAARTDVSEPLKQAVSLLQSKVQQDRQMVAANLQMAAGLQKITDSVGQVNSFEQNLTQFLRDNPGTERSSQLETVVKSEAQIWKGVATWHLLRRRLKLVDLTKISTTEASLLVTDCEELQRNSGPFGDELLKTELITALRAVAARSPDGKTSLEEQIRTALSRKTISKAYLIETKDGEKYYAAKAPTNNSGSTLTIEYFTTTTGTQTTSKNVSFNSVPDASAKKEDDDWLSPQTKMYRRIDEKLKIFATSDYDTALASVVKEVTSSTTVDALLRLLLVEELLQLGSKGSEGFRRRSAKILSDISARGVSRLTNWAAPGDTRAAEERADAELYLKTDAERISQELEMAVLETTKIQQSSIPPDLQCVGWMHKNSQSEWVVSLKPDLTFPANSTKLCIFYVPAQAQTAVTPVEIGRLTQESKLSVSVNAVADSPLEGRPAYLLLEDPGV